MDINDKIEALSNYGTALCFVFVIIVRVASSSDLWQQNTFKYCYSTITAPVNGVSIRAGILNFNSITVRLWTKTCPIV
jgi:hypothetical protein